MIFLILIAIVLLVVFGISFVFFADANDAAAKARTTAIHEQRTVDKSKSMHEFIQNINATNKQ